MISENSLISIFQTINSKNSLKNGYTYGVYLHEISINRDKA